MIRIRIGRVSLPGILAGLAMLSLAAPAFAQSAPPAAKWFRYAPVLDKTWVVSEAPGNPLQFDIERKSKAKGSASKRIFVLYPRASSAYDIAISKILQVFESKDIDASVTVINFAMKDAAGAQAIEFAEKEKTDLIFAMGSESTAWLFDHYRDGKIPVVSVCSKDPVQLGQIKDYETGSGTNFAFTSLNVPVDVQMAYVKELKPDLRNLTVLVDSKNISAVQTQAEPIAAYARDKGIQVIWGAIDNPAKAKDQLVPVIKNAVQTMRRNDPDLSKSLFWVTGSTSVFKEIRTINEHADRVPVVSVVPEIVTAGTDTAVLAIGVGFESNAHLAAIYGAEILAGRAKPGDLKVGLVSPPDIAISFLKVREIGLRVPFQFYETASFIYDYEGKAVRTVASRVSEDN
jgi:putative tryptophan/tyrosine transport system substrate-binding protein